jgi:GxxExxY protein
MKTEMNDLSFELIGSAIEVHRELGPGLLENTYEAAFCHELTLRNIPFERQKPVSVNYKGIEIECGYRIDVLADEKIVVEQKAVERLLPIHDAQLLTYLKLSNLHLGLLMNFNVEVMKKGVRRIINSSLD